MGDGGLVRREELLDMLARAGLKIGSTTLRRYQSLGIVPGPSAYGRPGRAKGVSWGWTREEADDVVRRVRIVQKHKRQGRQLMMLLADRPELSVVWLKVLSDEWEEGRKEGYAEGYGEGLRYGVEKGWEESGREVEGDVDVHPGVLGDRVIEE